jgi:Nucleotidyl transferase AbiEii toxin, Type IV TA system
MTWAPFKPIQVIPHELATVVDGTPLLVRDRRASAHTGPSIDVDFGVRDVRGLRDLLAQLARSGESEILERAPDTVHLRWNGLDVSVFVLPVLDDFIEDRHLSVTGVLATKLHAILDRGTRRDFFDLYVTLQDQRLGVVECLRAIYDVYRQDVNDGLLLRALPSTMPSARRRFLAKVRAIGRPSRASSSRPLEPCWCHR